VKCENKNSRWRVALPLVVIGGLALGIAIRRGCADVQPSISLDRPLLHHFLMAEVIPAEIKIYHPVSDPQALFKRCEQEVERGVRIFSNYLETSEVSRLNRQAAERPVQVSPDMARVLAASIEADRVTDGAFDITVMPLIRLWKKAGEEGRVPDSQTLAAVVAKVGMAAVRFDPGTREVHFSNPGIQTDLGGISKGYIIDRVTVILQDAGVTRALINIGGDLRVFGGTAARPFRVAVQHPLRRDELAGWVMLQEGAVATSGDYERFIEIDGRHYSHIIDPRTGMPAAWSPSVTVLAGDAMTADWLATGISVVGARAAASVAGRSPGTEYLVIQRNEAGDLEAVYSPGMGSRLHLVEDSGIRLP